jgi:hypothetical protein
LEEERRKADAERLRLQQVQDKEKADKEKAEKEKAAAAAAAPPPPSAQDAAANNHECVICLERPKNALLVPCGHLCLCMPCAQSLTTPKHSAANTCPLCRAVVTNVYQAFT